MVKFPLIKSSQITSSLTILFSVLVLRNLTWIIDFSSPWTFQYPITPRIDPTQLFALMIWLTPIVLIYIELMNIFIDYYHEHYILMRVRSTTIAKWLFIVIKAICIRLFRLQLYYGCILYIFNTKWNLPINIPNFLIHSATFYAHIFLLVIISIIVFIKFGRSISVVNIFLLIYVSINFIGLHFGSVRTLTLQSQPNIWGLIIMISLVVGLLKIISVYMTNEEYQF